MFLLISFLAGILTVLAPCVFPLLPVIIGGSLADKSKIRPYVITISLAASIVIFTLILKYSTTLIGVSPQFWKRLSGGIVILFGITYLFPSLWSLIMVKCRFEERAQKNLQASNKKKGVAGMILVGASLGPVFVSCSPTYSVILGTVLPANFFWGFLNLLAYALGLSLVMLCVALFGQKFIVKAKWAVDPRSWFRKILGLLFILVGVAIITGYDKKFEAWLLDKELIIDATQFEYQLLDSVTE